MEKKKNRGLVIFGLLALCAVLMAAVFIFTASPESGDNLKNMDNAIQNVTPDEIIETPDDTEVSAIKPNEILPSDTPSITIRPNEILPVELPVDSDTNTESFLTVMPEMPDPPELPDTAFRGEREGDATPEDVEAHKALDPALTNPDVKPDITPAPVQPDKTHDDRHLWWTINEKGELYAPGFGWLTYTGENIMHQSESDGDFNKIIGSMN